VLKSAADMITLTITAPLRRTVELRANKTGDFWMASFFYAGQVRPVSGEFSSSDDALNVAKSKAIELADAPSSTSAVICEDDDPTCKNPKVNH